MLMTVYPARISALSLAIRRNLLSSTNNIDFMERHTPAVLIFAGNSVAACLGSN